jgi:hypothetical protein
MRDTLSHWIKKNKIGFDISEIVVNWNAGGTSSISGLLENLIAYTAKTITTGQMN